MYGQGKMTYSNGYKYEGYWKNNLQNGQGTYTYASVLLKNHKEEYVGEWKDGKFNGQGTYIFTDGEKYVGEFKNGIRYGHGTLYSANGNKYVGVFKGHEKIVGIWVNEFGSIEIGECISGDCKNGIGIYTLPDGSKYEGEWKDSLMNGQGKMRMRNGDKYVGEYKNGLNCGQGTYTWIDGSVYEGEWKAGLKHGQGTYTDGGGEYVVDYIDLGYIRQGTMTFAKWMKNLSTNKDISILGSIAIKHNSIFNARGDFHIKATGSTYKGEWKDDLKHGKGTYIYVTGEKYIGEWKNGNMNGQGAFNMADGTIYHEGLWEDGEPVK